jgi:TPR repeat protein
VSKLNRWIPFFRNECLGKQSASDPKSKSMKKISKSKELSRLEANAWLALGVCAYMHWPLEQAIAQRKALRFGEQYDKRIAQEAEWKAIVKATKYLSKSADAGHACGCYNLGLLLESGFEDSKDMSDADDWLTGIALSRHKEGVTLADFNKDAAPRPEPKSHALASMRVGCGRPSDRARALHLYSRAAVQGLECAKCMLGLRRIATDFDGALQMLSSVSQKEAAAMYGIGILYLFHKSHDQFSAEDCRSRAFDSFRQASEQGHTRASFNAGMCKKLGIGTLQDAAYAREFFRAGVRRLDVRCMEQLAIFHLETEFAHSHPSTGVGLLQGAWRLGHRVVASKLAEIYSQGRFVSKNVKMATAWLAQVDQVPEKAQLTFLSGEAHGSATRQQAPISHGKAIGIVQVHENVVAEAIRAKLQQGASGLRLRDVVCALVEKASLDFALAHDVITAIAKQSLLGSSDLDKPLQADSLRTMFPFMSDGRQHENSFQGQSQLEQLYGTGLPLAKRLRVISTALFSRICQNFNTPEEAFLQYSRPEGRCHGLVNICLRGLQPGQCDERWQQRFSRFLEAVTQVGLMSYDSRRRDTLSLEQEYRLFQQGKPHELVLFDDNEADRKRGFGVPRKRGVVKGQQNLKSKSNLYGWHGKTLEPMKDPDTGHTAYRDTCHPLSVPSHVNDSAMLSRPVHLVREEMLGMFAARVGDSHQEQFDKSVACGVLTEFPLDEPGAALPTLEEYSEQIEGDLRWARAHLRYGGDLVIPAPDAAPAHRATSVNDGTVKHTLGRLLPSKYKEAIQHALDDLVLKACTDALLELDRRVNLPSGSPFKKDGGERQVCFVDVLSQHFESRDGMPAMVLKMQMVHVLWKKKSLASGA